MEQIQHDNTAFSLQASVMIQENILDRIVFRCWILESAARTRANHNPNTVALFKIKWKNQ